MSYAYRIAHAAASRDWAAIDAALAAWVADRPSIAVGVAQARRDASGTPDTLPPLEQPDPVTIHDLPPGTVHAVEHTNIGRHFGMVSAIRKLKL